jgi:hypothetical protein
MPDIRPGEEALVRTHEQHHHAMALFQPAQLCPFRAALLGMDASEEAAKSEDIVETLYAVLFPLLVGVPPRPDTFFPSRRQFQLLALRIYHIAQEMAKSAGGAVPQEEAATRAIQAIASLLSYAIPSRPRQGCTILREIEKLAPRPGWTNCMELSHDQTADGRPASVASGGPFRLPASLKTRPPAPACVHERQLMGNGIIAANAMKTRMPGGSPDGATDGPSSP